MQFTLKAWDIVGYTFNADIYCPGDIREMFASDLPNPDAYPDAESVLDAVAQARGIDRNDERSFDSGDFPKVILASQVEDDSERCGACHGALIG